MVVCVILYLYYAHAHEPLKLKALQAQKPFKLRNTCDRVKAVSKRLNSTSSKFGKRSANPALRVTGVRALTSDELVLATDNFSKENQIGQGGYGTVYKGKLPDGKLVAVKRAADHQPGLSRQGAPEFYNEIELLSRVHHKNLVTLEGYCGEKGHQMLVYDYMPGGTLRDRLFAVSGARSALDFAAHLWIALGAARGIFYLHTEANPAIIHRDIKASNILLDDREVAKVVDFGLSCLAPEPDSEGYVLVSTAVKGTPGYLDPEYYMTQYLTDKSDVYSFGVVMLELATATRATTEGKIIVQEANKRVGAGRSEELLAMVDPIILVECSATSEALERFMKLALRCCTDTQENRPTIGEVVRDLEAQLDQITSKATIASSKIPLPAAKPWRDLSSICKLPSPDSGGGGAIWSDDSMMRVSPR